MKRMMALVLILSLFLSGCGIFAEHISEPVTFYYIRSDYRNDMGEVIAGEEREASGHMGDLRYLMALYLMGPTDEEMVSPIPPGTRITSAEISAGGVHLKLSDTAQTLTDSEFTLACACLTMTCLSITQLNEVTITSGSRTLTMTRDSLELYDNSAENAATAATEVIE